MAAIISLRVDSVLVEVAQAFEREGVQWRLLKGAAIMQRLYGKDAERTYRDLDVLVRPRDEEPSYDALRALGFEPREGFGAPEAVALHHEWSRGADLVEVHVTLSGLTASAERTWGELAGHVQRITVNGAAVDAFDDAAMALHLALHAVQHGVAVSKGMDDLHRGLARLPKSAWSTASALAHRLGGDPAFAAAMGLAPASLVEDVPTTGRPTTEAVLRAQSANPLALGLARAADDRSATRRWIRLLFPSRQFLRRWASRDRERPLPYSLAYLWRLAYLLRHGPPGVLAYWRARRGTSAP